MFTSNNVHLLFSLLLSIPAIVSANNCVKQVDDCFVRFRADLESHKKKQFTDSSHGLNNICHETNGVFTKFVGCVAVTEEQCASDPNFKSMVCETRKLRLRISRYQWKANMFYEMCRNSSSALSRGIVEHEECISGVMNTRNWMCDVNYDKPRKMLDWKRELEQTCSLWRKFRDCSKQEVRQKCGTDAADISDYLFHSHQSYFDKYNACNLEGGANTQCWYDTLKSTTEVTVSTEATATQTTQHLSTDQTPLVVNNTATTHDIALQITTSESTISSTADSQHHDESSSPITMVSDSNLTETSSFVNLTMVVVNDTLSDEHNHMSSDSDIKAELAKYITEHNHTAHDSDHDSDQHIVTERVNILVRDNLKSDPTSSSSTHDHSNHNHNVNHASNGSKINFLLLIFIIYVTAIVVIY